MRDVSLDQQSSAFVQNAKPNAILQFNQEISGIEDLIPLTLGEPDFDVPEHIKAAAIKSISENDSHYGPSLGTEAFRKATAEFLNSRYGLSYESNQIIATIGVTEAIAATMRTILDPGDEVIVPAPNFPLYAAAAVMSYGKVVSVPTQDTGFVLTPERLEETLMAHPDAKAIVLTTPGNPTGVRYTQDQVEALVPILSEHNLFVISDEIYSELVFEGEHVSFAKYLPEQTILFNGVSKSHAMTGYRIGIIAAPQKLAQQLGVVHQLLVTAPTNAAVAAATEAFANGPDDALPMKDEYVKRRNHLMQVFDDLGMEYAYPDGAFYLFVKVPRSVHLRGFDLALDIAKKAKVGVTPGVAFGEEGADYIRLSYATAYDLVVEAGGRLRRYFTPAN
jgi:aminotransferase